MACTLGVQHLQQPMIVASDGKLLGWLESRMARVTNRVSASLYNHEAGHVQGATPSRGSGAASAFIPLLTLVSDATHHILGHPLKQARCKCATACKAVRRSWKLVLRMGTITAMLHSCARDPQAHTRKLNGEFVCLGRVTKRTAANLRLVARSQITSKALEPAGGRISREFFLVCGELFHTAVLMKSEWCSGP